MRSILQKRPLRYIFAANMISMLGSGMNSAAVAWYILTATHSEIALGTFAVLQTLPAMLMLPFTGVIIDREDRRRLVMLLGNPSCDHSRSLDPRFCRKGEGVGTLLDEHACGSRLLDVLADHYCTDPGINTGRRVRSRQYFSPGWNPGRLADCRIHRRIRVQPYWSWRRTAD